MFTVFRKIRQVFLVENKAGKYLLYALGEILLVVIGILIALQINNWNEDRQKHETMLIALQSLKEDLKADTTQLKEDIAMITTDSDRLLRFNARLSKPSATFDTLLHIARYEYVPFFNPSNELNRNTITSLLNTGNIGLFENELGKRIMDHNVEQISLIKVMDENVSIFLNGQFAEGIILQSEKNDSRFVNTTVKGPLLEQYWANKDEKVFLNTMLNTLTSKALMYRFVLWSKERLLERTLDLLDFIEKYEQGLDA